MDALTRRQLAFNAESREGWRSFAGHRARVSALLRSGAPAGRGRLCVLGAGNANDLDLPALGEHYREVHLVDLDAEALARGAARQGVADHPGVHRHGGVDLTGRIAAMATWSPRSEISPPDLAACLDEPARRVGPLLPGPFDLVASTCVLSQLIGGVVAALGEGHPRFLEALQAVRAGHLRLLAHLARPGGTAVLITDVVSSDTVPALASVPEAALGRLLTELVVARNFFHGVNPALLASLPRRDPVLSARVEGVETVAPWRWDLGPRLYLVWAMRLRIGAVAPPGPDRGPGEDPWSRPHPIP